ncbi:hypothetical protein ACFP3Q_05380 [Nocardioides sp. GCM10027113]|uniref:hypothetical protein n=1 Tax=unclassified Nocardioides TaxID=2615069 RepID=UPI0036187BDF
MVIRTGAVAALLLSLVACTADEGPSADSSPAASSEPSGTTGAEPGETDPLTIMGKGRGCASLPGTYVMYEQVRVDRPVTLTGLRLADAEGIELLERSVSRRPDGEVPSSGWVLVGAPGKTHYKRRIGWSGREPLVGARLEPKTDYYVIARMRMTMGGSMDGLDIGWDDGGTTGNSQWQGRTEVRKDCV